MKKYILISMIGIFFIVSCQKDEKQYFSCNKDINNWVVKHKKDVNNITREQLITLPIGYQKAIYNSFSKERKSSLWKEKINILLSDNSFSNEYKAKIKELLKFIKPKIYDRKLDEKPDKYVTDFINNWEKDVLGHYETDTAVFSINFCTFMTLAEFDYYMENYKNFDYSWLNGGDEIIIPTYSRTSGGGGSCTCRYDVYCSIFFNIECVNGLNNCTPNYNCGVAGNSECNGQCEGAESAQPDGN